MASFLSSAGMLSEPEKTNASGDQGGTSIACIFTTSLPAQFKVDPTPIEIPTTAARATLSDVINHLLDASDEPRPFDFCINDELLRSNIQSYLDKHKLSTEITLNIEYMLLPPPPKEQDTVQADEWVAAIHLDPSQRLVFALFDGSVVDMRNEETVKYKNHEQPISGAIVMQKNSDSIVVTSSLDHSLCAHDKSSGHSFVFVGHDAPVRGVAASPSRHQCVSWSEDASLKVWDFPTAASRSTKKVAGTNSKKGPSTMERSPVSTLHGHDMSIQAACWPTNNSMYSASDDGFIRCWDVENSETTSKFLVGTAATTGISFNSRSGLIASSHTDRTVRVWDYRMKDGSALVNKVNAHLGWVTCVSWDPNSDHKFASSSIDCSTKVCDMRANIATYTIRAHSDEVTCMDWSEGRIATGSKDGTVKMFNTNSAEY